MFGEGELLIGISVNSAGQLLSNVAAWGGKEANIRSVVLVGSRARSESPDELADIDVQVYAETREAYTRDDAWLSEIGQTWLCVRDEYVDGDIRVPTRLVIFAGGVKVDFAFYPAGILSNGISAGLAHRILLDKDGAARDREAGSVPLEQRARPSEAEFVRVVQEFWFEAYHVAKYLARNELWLAKSRDWATKELLLRVIEWNDRITHGRDYDTQCAGEHTRSCVREDVWEELHRAFAGFEREESWGALLVTAGIFRRLARKTAVTLGFSYPADVDKNISEFILDVRGASQSRS